jgi:hypothetical protein
LNSLRSSSRARTGLTATWAWRSNTRASTSAGDGNLMGVSAWRSRVATETFSALACVSRSWSAETTVSDLSPSTMSWTRLEVLQGQLGDRPEPLPMFLPRGRIPK